MARERGLETQIPGSYLEVPEGLVLGGILSFETGGPGGLGSVEGEEGLLGPRAPVSQVRERWGPGARRSEDQAAADGGCPHSGKIRHEQPGSQKMEGRKEAKGERAVKWFYFLEAGWGLWGEVEGPGAGWGDEGTRGPHSRFRKWM